jgi:hypothetical protein
VIHWFTGDSHKNGSPGGDRKGETQITEGIHEQRAKTGGTALGLQIFPEWHQIQAISC